jgi:hypothetical protein
MPTPTRPVASAVIGTVWGQQVHDYTFAPAGCIVSGAGIFMLTGNAYRDGSINTADEDPAGYLDAANDRVEVPTDGAGLYAIVLSAITLHGAASDETGIVVRLNGSEIGRVQAGQEDETEVSMNLTLIEPLTVGDQISLRCRQIGSGDRAAVAVRSLSLVRIGAELGAPS